MQVPCVSCGSAATVGPLLRAADNNTAMAASLIKSTNAADEQIVNKLVGSATGKGGSVDISA